MKPSEFQTTIENQFDYICKVALEDERKDYLKASSRQCKRETLFCDMDDYTAVSYTHLPNGHRQTTADQTDRQHPKRNPHGNGLALR